jgi:hypothetical protein
MHSTVYSYICFQYMLHIFQCKYKFDTMYTNLCMYVQCAVHISLLRTGRGVSKGVENCICFLIINGSYSRLLISAGDSEGGALLIKYYIHFGPH